MSWFNPHLTVRGIWFGHEFINEKATNPNWEKWRPRNPTSAHWYDEARLQRYLAAHVARDRDLGQRRTVREFIGEFRGLSGTAIQRKILTEVGCSHQSLASFFGADRVNARRHRQASRGDEPIQQAGRAEASRRHRRRTFQRAVPGRGRRRRHLQVSMPQRRDATAFPTSSSSPSGYTRPVWRKAAPACPAFSSPAPIGAPRSTNPFRRFGSTGEGLENTLAKVRANVNQPVICALHLASARLQFADRGKSSIILTDDAEQPDD